MYRNSNEAIMSMENQPNYAASGSSSISFNRNLPWIDLTTISSAVKNVDGSSFPYNYFVLFMCLGPLFHVCRLLFVTNNV